jgi:DNA modification methylase
MNYIHKDLASGRWQKLTFFEQMANIGSEIFRTISWRKKNSEYSQKAFERGLELLDLTIEANHDQAKFKELTRLREILIDYFLFNNKYSSSDKFFENYFYSFNYAA